VVCVERVVTFALTVLCFLVHGQVTIIFVVSVGLFDLFVQSFSQPSLIRFRSN